jgi:DNA-binding CsgD family transcriptional regulator
MNRPRPKTSPEILEVLRAFATLHGGLPHPDAARELGTLPEPDVLADELGASWPDAMRRLAEEWGLDPQAPLLGAGGEPVHRSRRPSLTDRNERIVRRVRDDGMAPAAVAEEEGLTPGRIYQILSAAGVRSERPASRGTLPSATPARPRSERDERIVQRVRVEGAPVARVAEEEGLTAQRVYQILARAGAKKRRPRAPAVEDRARRTQPVILRPGEHPHKLQVCHFVAE